jgi:hypothetical protein
MDFDTGKGNCVIAKCSINGKDAGGAQIYGLILAAADARDLLYTGALFSRDAIDGEAPLSEIYALVNAARPEVRSEELGKYESQVCDYIATSRIFQNEKNFNDIKSLEHKITYFCLTALSLNAITFLDLTRMNRTDLELTLPALKRAAERAEAESEERAEDEAKAAAEKDGDLDVVVACEPVLDPVAGVAIGDLVIGDTICCRLKADSVYYTLMKKASPDFDGVVTGEISGIQTSATGAATVALKLSDEITGALKLAGTVRVKTVRRAVSLTPEGTKLPRPVQAALAVGGLIVFLCLMALLLHFFS